MLAEVAEEVRQLDWLVIADTATPGLMGADLRRPRTKHRR